MTGPPVQNSNPNKIKGGRWTVAKFFCLSIAYTVVWMTLSSELGYFKSLYGPQILLQMNIAYFLPSIPLLAVSSLMDEWLDARLGVARTILVRLLVGLGGCAAICSVYPFQPQNGRWLLGAIVALGLFHGIAFSASYQMVSRFANKNTISLGLGCVGSGLLVLVLELGLQIGSKPSRRDNILLFMTATGFVLLGFLSAISLLLRHWRSIERYSANMVQPLLEQQEEGIAGQQQRPAMALEKTASIRMLGFTPLSFFDTISEGESMIEGAMELPSGRKVLRHPSFSLDHPSVDAPAGPSPLRRSVTLPVSPQQAGSLQRGSPRLEAVRKGTVIDTIVERSECSTASQTPFAQGIPSSTEGTAGHPCQQAAGHPAGSHLVRSSSSMAVLAEVLRGIWPVMLALFLSGLVVVLVFPFFTYVPAKQLDDLLPKALFFSAIFANVVGRLLPKFGALSIKSPSLLVALGTGTFAAVPLCFVYIKSAPRWHDDTLALMYVIIIWAICGFVNTTAYMTAPTLVSGQLKANAAGLMAITSQVSHTAGLLLAVVVAIALFGGIAEV